MFQRGMGYKSFDCICNPLHLPQSHRLSWLRGLRKSISDSVVSWVRSSPHRAPTSRPTLPSTLPSKHFSELFPNSPSLLCNTSIYGLDYAKQNRSMIRAERCYDGRHSMQLPSQCQTNDYTPGMIHMYCATTVPKINCNPIELLS